MNHVDISVVVITRGKAKYLERTLESLVLQQVDGGAFEIIVVDNGSTDETADVVDRYGRLDARVRFVAQREPNRTLARSAGISRAAGGIIAFVDDDCICPRNLVDVHLRTHREGGGRTVVVGARREIFTALPVDDDLALAIARAGAKLDPRITSCPVPELLSLCDIWDIRHRMETLEGASSGTSEPTAQRTPWFSFTSRHCSLPLDLCRSIGSIDDQDRGWCGEDAEFAYRLWKSGASFVTLSSVAVLHQTHPHRAGR
jgi:glycosyltransferase involved in cell wall biosynthesis